MNNTSPGLTRVFSALCALACAASAQPIPPDEKPLDEFEAPPLEFTITAYGDYTFDANFDEGGGSMVVNRFGVGLGVTGQPTERLRLGAGIDHEASFYNFDGDVSILGFSEPLDEATITSLFATAGFELGDSWWLNGGGGVRAGVEGHASHEDGLTYFGYLAPTYQPNKNLRFGAGVLVASRLEDDELIVPIIIVEWRISDTLSLSNAPGVLRGPGAQLAYRYSDSLSFTFDASYEQREFRLDEDAAVDEGVARDTRIPIALGAIWRPLESLRIVLRSGLAFGSELELFDDEGESVFNSDLDTAPFASLNLSFSL